MAYSLAPWFVQRFFDTDGTPLVGGLVSTWVTGSSTPLDTYSDASGTPNTNPIVTNTHGFVRMYLQPTSYKITVTDANGVPVGLDMDPVTATDAGSGGLGGVGAMIWDFGSNSSTPITATTYAAGATFDKLQPGSTVFQVDSADLPGSYAIQATGLMGAAGTLTVALVNLSDGAPDTPIATCTITSLTGAVATSGTIVFGAVGVQKQYGIKPIVSANSGYLRGISLVRTA